MARKDNKGRNLKTGEYQRPDGRYEYRYKDEITGKRNSVYAADLASLREMEKKINKDMDDLLITDASVKKLTVNTLFERYMATKNIKERTKKNYIRMWDYRIRNTLGNIRVVDFKTSHVRTFFFALSDEGLAHSTIKGLYGLLNPSFELAVEDGIIRKNPVTGTLGDYGAPAKEKEALTLEQQEKLLKFVEQSNVYKPHLPMMQVMFGACLRVLWSSFFVTLRPNFLPQGLYNPVACLVRRFVVIIRMRTYMIILYIRKFFDCCVEFFLCVIIMLINKIIFQCIEISFHRSIIIWISSLTHALSNTKILTKSCELF